MAIHKVSDGPDQGTRVQVTMDAHPGSLVVHWVEWVQLVVEQQQLLAVAAGRAVHPVLLPVYPATGKNMRERISLAPIISEEVLVLMLWLRGVEAVILLPWQGFWCREWRQASMGTRKLIGRRLCTEQEVQLLALQ